MPRRHESLIPLTHDHHHALAQARRLRLATQSDGTELLSRSREFLDFFHADILDHFREEEEVVFPLAKDDDRASDLIARLLMEHAQIQAMIVRLLKEVDEGGVDPNTAGKLAEMLQAHIRLEEGELFPLLEKIVPDGKLRELDPKRRRS